MESVKRKLVLENGMEFIGDGFGDRTRAAVCELVFCTAMAGYQEVVSNPSNAGLGLCMTYPVIGSCGIADEDFEAKTPQISALIVRQYNDSPSNFRSTKTLSELLEEHRIPALQGIDTRALTRTLRDEGSLRAMLCDIDVPTDEAVKIITQNPVETSLVAQTSCKKRWYKRCANHMFNVVAIDCGIKQGILRSLNARGCNVTLLPHTATAQEIAAIHPDGVLLSNGPGSPDALPQLVQLICDIRGKYPLFGIELGHQLVCLAYGARSYKRKVGHRGGNYPVKNLLTGKVEITAQSHSYDILPESLAGTGLQITHRNLLDDSVEGVRDASARLFSVQHYPDGGPGPQEGGYLFDQFIRLMQGEC